MSLTWIIYIWGILDQLQEFLKISSITSVVFSVIACAAPGLAMEDMKAETVAKCRIWAKRFLAIGATAAVIGAFVPSSKTFAAMVVIPAVAESEAIQKDLPEIYDAAKKALLEKLNTK